MARPGTGRPRRLGRAGRAGTAEEQRASALEQRIDADLALGRHAELLPELEALVREEPLRERRRAQLMLALYQSGRQADALDVYRNGRKLLADELGLEPGAELRQLEKAILEHDPWIRRARSPAATRDCGRRAAAAESLADSGRERALLVAGALVAVVLALTGGSEAVTVEPNWVAAIDLRTGRIEAAVPIGGHPVAIAVGEGGVWVANRDRQTLVRIDPKSKDTTAIGLGTDVADVAVGFGSVWVAGGNGETGGTLIRIPHRTNAPGAPIDPGKVDPLAPQPVFLVATGAGSVWITRGNELMRIDPDTNEARPWFRVKRPQGLAAGTDAVVGDPGKRARAPHRRDDAQDHGRGRPVGAAAIPGAVRRLPLAARLRRQEAPRLAPRRHHAHPPYRNCVRDPGLSAGP